MQRVGSETDQIPRESDQFSPDKVFLIQDTGIGSDSRMDVILSRSKLVQVVGRVLPCVPFRQPRTFHIWSGR